MFTRKFWVLSLISVFIAASCACLYAAERGGYFGNDEESDFSEANQTYSEDDADQSDDTDSDYVDDNALGEEVPIVDKDAVDIPQEPKRKPALDLEQLEQAKPYDKYEKQSTNTAKVIKSYGLNKRKTDALIEAHQDAEKGVGNQAKAERYERIFRKNPNDFLAAYRIAELQMAMGHKGGAENWLKKVLKINPNYSPAKQLMKKAKNR